MLRIATVDNLSARAYTLLPPAFPADVMPCTPTEVYSRAARDMCDAALLPVARLRDVQDRYEPAGCYGIACLGPVQSVALFSKRPMERIFAERVAVHVTQKSQTSRELFLMLCQGEFGVEPPLANNPEETDARLLIGNDAFDAAREELSWPYVKDLCGWWREQTGFPFVFARWVSRRGLEPERRRMLLEWLDESAVRAESPAGLAQLADAARPLFKGDDGRERALHYYRAVRPRLTPLDLSGLSVFLRRQEEREGALWAKTA